MSLHGTFPTSGDVRSPVANGVKRTWRLRRPTSEIALFVALPLRQRNISGLPRVFMDGPRQMG
jgi:hypothetical protein